MVEDLLDVRLEEIGGYLVFLQKTVNMCDALLGVFLKIFEDERSKVIIDAGMTSTHVCVAQHFFHDEVVVNRLGELFTLIGALGLLVVPNLLVELQLRHRLVAVVFAIIFEQLKT